MKIAILTNFMDMLPGYSLVSIVQDQVRMLLERGDEVDLFVCEQYNHVHDDLPEAVKIKKVIPFDHLKDYHSIGELTKEHEQFVEKLKKVLEKELPHYDMAWTHDWVFQGYCMPYALAMQQLKLPDVKFLHWLHSLPTAFSNWWDIRKYGKNHKLVSFTETQKRFIAEHYRGTVEDVRVIPHIKDLRTWYNFSQQSCDFIKDHPALMQADIVQVYPASSDRFESKRVHHLITIFSKLKQFGFSVCLVIANQWANVDHLREKCRKYLRRAESEGLIPNKEFAFTSLWRKETEVGICKRTLRELQLCQNLFVFPTNDETFGLVGPEAALSGAYIVWNNSMDLMGEIYDNRSLNFDFGSFHRDFKPESGWENYLEAVALMILGRMKENEALVTKTIIRQKYNYDTLYDKYYSPIMAESIQWVPGKVRRNSL